MNSQHRSRARQVDALGFGTELLRSTSGAATAPQMRFDGFELLELDPFWRPTTEDELEEHGQLAANSAATFNKARALINAVRKRKGLPSEFRHIGDAEKGKTQNRIKG